MQNDKWTNQTWIVPRDLETRISREGENWYVEVFGGPRMQIDKRLAEITVEGMERWRAAQHTRNI